MGMLADVVRDYIKKEVNSRIGDIDGDVNEKLEILNAGGAEADKVEAEIDEIQVKLDDLEKLQEDIDEKEEQLEKVQATLDTTQKGAEATEKSSTIGGALNPVMAALSVVQKFVIEKVKSELKDLKDVKTILKPTAENIGDYAKDTKKKIKRAIDDRKEKQRIRKEKMRKLSN
tara:strand:- start:2946 stop:3464 length:519 start_codon:yes stop_codon:yes gene_type:complete